MHNRNIVSIFELFYIRYNYNLSAHIEMSANRALPQLPDWSFDDEFDGGDETCGRVIVNLHLYLRDQQPGTRVLVISQDPAAPIELPAWCRMTKNRLMKMQHPYYLITLKPNSVRN